MARNTFPASNKLMINEYGVINDPDRTATVVEVVNLLKQSHAFSLTGHREMFAVNLATLATLNLDLYLT